MGLSAPNKGHFGSHDVHKLNIYLKGQAGHMKHRLGYMGYIHHCFYLHRTISLWHSCGHGARHVSQRIAYIDLAAGNIKGATVKRQGFCQARDRMF